MKIKWNQNLKLHDWIAIIAFLLVLVLIIISSIFHNEIKDYFTIIKIKEIPGKALPCKPVPCEPVEVIKWVERTKTPTDIFITHLKPSLDPKIAKEIAESIDKYSKEYQLPRKLIVGIIFRESSFNIFARSEDNAIGLMQVIPKYHKDKIEKLGITDNRHLYHIDNNINLGCMVWKKYYNVSKGDLDETFHRYLSKNASEKQKNAYKGDILEIWGELEFFSFKYENEKGKDNDTKA